jgi:hypothetical protein
MEEMRTGFVIVFHYLVLILIGFLRLEIRV